MTPAIAPPAVVVVASAARDLTSDDPRGWRLGGGVTYGSLTTARLGIPTAALIGVDPEAARAPELDLLAIAGVDVELVPLARGPVFVNRELPGGRVQQCVEPGEPIDPAALPARWRGAPAWLFAPVADELPDAWAAIPSPDARVALGWQGLLRVLVAGQPVTRRAPRPSALVARADIVGVSHHDLDPGVSIGDLLRFLDPPATLVLTDGPAGGLAVEVDAAGTSHQRRYPAIPAASSVDPTGAGDVFLAALLAARIDPRLRGSGRSASDMRIAAAAASLVVERHGLAGVPELGSLVRRLRASLERPGASSAD